MSKVIVYTNDNGGLSVTVPTGEISIEEVQAKDTPSGSLIVNADELPNQYNDFFDAWELVNGKVEVSLVKAKEFTKNRLRTERKPLLATQDIAFQRAFETGADTSAIVAEKQRLRDITQLADQATTLEELAILKV
jgi:hypothetical protein